MPELMFNLKTSIYLVNYFIIMIEFTDWGAQCFSTHYFGVHNGKI